MCRHASDRAVGMQRRNGAIPGAERVTLREGHSGVSVIGRGGDAPGGV